MEIRVDSVEEDGEEDSVKRSETDMPAPKGKVNHTSTSWCRRLLKTLPQRQRGAQKARANTKLLCLPKLKGLMTQNPGQALG